MPLFDFIWPSASGFVTTLRQKGAPVLVASIESSVPGKQTVFVPLSKTQDNQTILDFINDLTTLSENASFDVEGLIKKYLTLWDNAENVKTVLQLVIEMRNKELASFHAEDFSSSEAQLAYLKTQPKKLGMHINLFFILHDVLFLSAENKTEKIEFLKNLGTDLSLFLENISQGLFAGAYLDSSDALIASFEKHAPLLIDHVIDSVKTYLKFKPGLDETDELISLFQLGLTFYASHARLQVAQGLQNGAQISIQASKIYTKEIAFFFDFLDTKASTNGKYRALYSSFKTEMEGRYQKLLQDNAVDNRMLHGVILGATDCFLEPPLSYNVSLIKCQEKAEFILKELKAIACLDNASVEMIKNSIVMLHGFNMRHYDFPWPIVDPCKDSILELQRILSQEKLTLVTKTIQFRLNEHLTNLKRRKVSLDITQREVLEYYTKKNANEREDIDQVETELKTLITLLSSASPKPVYRPKAKKSPRLKPAPSVVPAAAPQEMDKTLKNQLTKLQGQVTSLRQEKAHAIHRCEVLEKQCEVLKQQRDSTPRPIELELALSEAQDKARQLQGQVDTLEQRNRQQKGVYDSQLHDQDKTQLKLLASAQKEVARLSKQVEKLTNENKRLIGVSFKQGEGKLTLQKQAAEHIETLSTEHAQRVAELTHQLEAIKQSGAIKERDLRGDASRKEEYLKKQNIIFRKQFQYFHQRFIQASALNQVYAAQSAFYYQRHLVSGALVSNLSAQVDALREVSLKVSDAPTLDFTGDLISALHHNPLLVTRLLLISVQQNKFFGALHYNAISQAIAHCFHQGLQGYLSLVTVIAESSACTTSLPFLYQYGVLQNILPLLWPSPEDPIMQQWFTFTHESIQKMAVRDPFEIVSYLMLASYEVAKTRNVIPVKEEILINNLVDQFLNRISGFKSNEKMAFKNRLLQELPGLIQKWHKWQQAKKGVSAVWSDSAREPAKPVVFSRVVNFNSGSTPPSEDECKGRSVSSRNG